MGVAVAAMHDGTDERGGHHSGRRIRRSAVMTDPAAAGKPGKTSWKHSTSHHHRQQRCASKIF
jgi:hypothetical protein